jgi:hypothetical protein
MEKTTEKNSPQYIPCDLDHNGECLICDCWISDCAWIRYLKKDYKYESEEELKELFKDYLKNNEENDSDRPLPQEPTR